MALAAALSVIIVTGLFAQAQTTTGAVFEVASVKPGAPGGRGMSINRSNGGRITTANVPLRFLITFAWDVRDFQITVGPGGSVPIAGPSPPSRRVRLRGPRRGDQNSGHDEG
ncbi:MAG: hypothetical protein QOJ99_2490, partial [Bryobacterales bacterium]|nr:hypothetical protein [Bryobacterales bacterium]